MNLEINYEYILFFMNQIITAEGDICNLIYKNICIKINIKMNIYTLKFHEKGLESSY